MSMSEYQSCWTYWVLVVLEHLGFGLEVVCGWYRVFIPAVPLFQNVGVQAGFHRCIQDHLELCGFHLPRHSDAPVFFSHQPLRKGRKEAERDRRARKVKMKEGKFWLVIIAHAVMGLYFVDQWCRVSCWANEARSATHFRQFQNHKHNCDAFGA